MKARDLSRAILVCAAMVVVGTLVRAQAPPPQTPPAGGRGAGGRGRAAAPAPAEAYPSRPPADPAVLDRGKTLYSVNCAFCHGIDARGGDGGGPNLLRSQLVLGDQHGEAIAEVVQNGRPGTLMQPLKLTDAQISDIAAYIHSFRVGGYDITRKPPVSIIVGDAKAGAAAFQARCASCHSASGDLKGLASRIPDERDLQQAWLMPSTGGRGARGARGGANVPQTTATVTLPSGQTVTGRLLRIDDFLITLELPNGVSRSIARKGDSPKVEIKDPLEPHRALLPQYTDNEIHNITAYLVTLK